jgi:hypothetical protein
MADSDSPWSSEQEESLDGDSWTSDETASVSGDWASLEPSRFFSQSNDTRPLGDPCICVFPPINNGLPRKLKALHAQLIELAESLLCIDRPQQPRDRKSKILQPNEIRVWENAVKALNALQVPANGYLDESQDKEVFTTKAMRE